MMLKGMHAWTDYVAKQLNVTCEKTPWGARYPVPPESGSGSMEYFEEQGRWVVWRSDFVMNKALQSTYVQDAPYYIAFIYRETSLSALNQEAAWPSDEVVHLNVQPGLFMKATGVYFYTTYFDGFPGKDVMDFIASIQSCDDESLMKRISPILRQMQARSGEGLSLRLFLESRVLEIASILIEVSEKEQRDEKIPLSAFDTAQLHKVIEILEQRMANPPAICELARTVALNEYKLKAGFRQLFGTTIFEYLRLLRMEKAAGLLRAGQLSAQEVGKIVGYTTPHGFAGAFKKYYGATPAEWQERLAQGQSF